MEINKWKSLASAESNHREIESTSRYGNHQEVYHVLSDIEPDTCILNIGHNMC